MAEKFTALPQAGHSIRGPQITVGLYIHTSQQALRLFYTFSNRMILLDLILGHLVDDLIQRNVQPLLHTFTRQRQN